MVTEATPAITLSTTTILMGQTCKMCWEIFKNISDIAYKNIPEITENYLDKIF
jgi:hypothetical protein